MTAFNQTPHVIVKRALSTTAGQVMPYRDLHFSGCFLATDIADRNHNRLAGNAFDQSLMSLVKRCPPPNE